MNLNYRLFYSLLLRLSAILFYLQSCTQANNLPIEEQTLTTQVASSVRTSEKFFVKEKYMPSCCIESDDSQATEEKEFPLDRLHTSSSVFMETSQPLYANSTCIDKNGNGDTQEQYKRKLKWKQEEKTIEVKRRKISQGDFSIEEEQTIGEPSHYLIKYQCLLSAAVKGDMEAQFKLGRRAYKTWQKQGDLDAAQEAKVWLRRAAAKGYQPSIVLLTKLECESLNEQKDLAELPTEAWAHILSYIKYPEILSARGANHLFYELITGSNEFNIVGVNNILKSVINSGQWVMNKYIDFKDEKLNKLTPETIPSFFFYHLMGEVKNLPCIFWPYLKDTKVYMVNLSGNRLGTSGVINFAKSLRGTNIHMIMLNANNIEDLTVIELAKYFQDTKVRIVELDCNKISNVGIIEFAQHLVSTDVCTVSLGNNTRIDSTGIITFAENLKNTKVRQVRLLRNKIERKTKQVLREQYTNINWIFS